MARNFSYLLPTGWQRVASAHEYYAKRMRALGLDPSSQADWNRFSRLHLAEQAQAPSLRAMTEAGASPPSAAVPAPAASPTPKIERVSNRDVFTLEALLARKGFRRIEGTPAWADDQGGKAVCWYDRGQWHATIEGARP